MNTICKECKEEQDEELPPHGLCMVCWEMEYHPETFTVSPQEYDEWTRASKYVLKHGITANGDGAPL